MRTTPCSVRLASSPPEKVNVRRKTMEETSKPKRRWPLFLGGFLVGSFTTVVVLGLTVLFFVIRDFSKDCANVVLTDEGARSKIEQIGVKLPNSATNLYYALQPQFADYHDTWVSFSANAMDCTNFAHRLASREIDAPVFVPGTRSRHEPVTKGPAYHQPALATPRWNLTTVTNGGVFEARRLFILVDTGNNRVYVSTRTR